MYGWLALEIMSKGSNHYITIHPLNQFHMEKTLIRRKNYSLKFIKNTVLFGISYDKPNLFIAFLCFIIEIEFPQKIKPSAF
jgi:hypothetical protein